MRNRPLFAAAAALLALLTCLQVWSLWRAPAAWFPAGISVQLAPGATMVLGRHELAAPQAERAHIAVRRDASGHWLLRKLSASTTVSLHSGSEEHRLGSAALQAGQRFQAGGSTFDIVAVADGAIDFRSDAQGWRYDGATLYRDGRALAACADARLAVRAVALWNRAAPRALTVARPLTFGGNVHCGNRLGIPGAPPGAAQLARAGNSGQLLLTAGAEDAHTALRLTDAAGQHDLRQEERELAGVSAIVVGRTRFQLATEGDRLQLTPTRKVALFSTPDVRLPPQVAWQWRKRSLWLSASTANAPSANWLRVPLAVALAALAFLAAISPAASAIRQGRAANALAPRRSNTRATVAAIPADGAAGAGPARLLAAAALMVAGAAALLLQRAGHPPGAACSLLLGAASLSLWLFMPGRSALPLPAAAALVLMAAGLLAQLELGLGADDTSWLRFYQKSTALLAVASGLTGLLHGLVQRSRDARQPGVFAPQRRIEWALALFAAAALAALTAQVLWGDETGVFDLQPVELAKLALTALTAHCLALRMDWRADAGAGGSARWLRLIAPALLFLALLGLALIQVDDYSPLILLAVWAVAMALAYALAARNIVLAVSLSGVVLAVAGGIALLRGAGSENLAQWPLAASFYGDRFQVWLAPAEHPHTGQQLLLGARAIAGGGWWGADQWLGLRSLGQAVGAPLAIPAVQDDFAPAFFLNRHGLSGALMLWAAQAAFVIGMLHLAARAHAAASAARDFRQAWLGRFRYFALCGGAAFVLGHLLLSWGTNLAIFPIMGQPMSFLSAGGSHLLFFLCPLLAFCTTSAHSLEENESCRSTSNTKS